MERTFQDPVFGGVLVDEKWVTMLMAVSRGVSAQPEDPRLMCEAPDPRTSGPQKGISSETVSEEAGGE